MADSKWKSKDWWLGRTPEWQARQQAVRGAGESVKSAGGSMRRLGFVLVVWVTVPLVLLVVTGPFALVLIPLWVAGVVMVRRKRAAPTPQP